MSDPTPTPSAETIAAMVTIDPDACQTARCADRRNPATTIVRFVSPALIEEWGPIQFQVCDDCVSNMVELTGHVIVGPRS